VKATVIFDNECSLCRQFTDLLKKWDTPGRFAFRPLQDHHVYADFPQLQPENCERAIHFIDESGHIFVGADVIAPLLKSFPRAKKIVWMLGFEPVKTASGKAYGLIARYRKVISKLFRGSRKS
jgi:predicted DCC family thiol-disulfide oxidoreductase YuxK